MSRTWQARLVLGVPELEIPELIVEEVIDGCYDDYGLYGSSEGRVVGYSVEVTEYFVDIEEIVQRDLSYYVEDFKRTFHLTPTLHMVVDNY